LFVALKQLLEPAVHLYTTFGIYFTDFLIQLQGVNGTELICVHIVLNLRLQRLTILGKDGGGD